MSNTRISSTDRRLDNLGKENPPHPLEICIFLGRIVFINLDQAKKVIFLSKIYYLKLHSLFPQLMFSWREKVGYWRGKNGSMRHYIEIIHWDGLFDKLFSFRILSRWSESDERAWKRRKAGLLGGTGEIASRSASRITGCCPSLSSFAVLSRPFWPEREWVEWRGQDRSEWPLVEGWNGRIEMDLLGHWWVHFSFFGTDFSPT